jgi:hypothetical protein
VWNEVSAIERFVVRHFGPVIMTGVFDSMIHPGVYRSVGLPGWRTWNSVRKTPARRTLRNEAFRPVYEALSAAGAFQNRRRPPRAWRAMIRASQPTLPTVHDAHVVGDA